MKNRVIKFRGLTANPNLIKNHESYWVYGLINESGDDEFPFVIDGCYVKPETIGQSIDLKDKNDIDIYEGDVIECERVLNDEYRDFHTGKVTWNCLNKSYYIHSVKQELSRSFGGKEIIKIIGNIHENKEFLK